MMRRRAMMGERPEWDFEWDYTMGDPTQNGMNVDKTSSGATGTLTSEGFQITTTSGSYYYQLYISDTNMRRATSGVMEVVFKPTNLLNAQENFVMRLGNNDYGIRTVIIQDSSGATSYFWKISDGTTKYDGTKLWSTKINKNTEYKLKLVLYGNKNYEAYVNDVLTKSGVLGSVTTLGTLSVMQRGGASLLKSFKLKFNRTE